MSNISSAGLIELKAELFRKQEEFKKEKLQFASTNCIKRKTTAKKATICSKKNSGVTEQTKKEEEDSLQKSRNALELKSQLYEKIVNDSNIPDEDGSQIFLVDFQKKAIDKISMEKYIASSKESDEEEEEEEFDSSTEDPEQQWTEYTDSLGRTRTCLKKDLKFMQERDQTFGLLSTEKNSEEIPSQATSVSDEPSEILDPQERYRQMLHEKWDAEERKATEGPIGPIHYENIRFDEVRTHGVSYFRFSKEEVERKEQMNLLNSLRDQTKEERNKRELLKEKRDAMMAARLKKVKDRQRAKLGLPPEVEEPTIDEKLKQENECEKQNEEPVKRIEPLSKNSLPMREWDIGKDKFFEREKEYFNQMRNERKYEFAPPHRYENVSKEMNFAPPKEMNFAPPKFYNTMNSSKRQNKDYVTQDRNQLAQKGKKSKMSQKQTVKMDNNCTQLNMVDTANIPLPGETKPLDFVDNSSAILSEGSHLSTSTHQEQQPILNYTQPISPIFTAPPLYNTQHQNTCSVPLEISTTYPDPAAVTFQNNSVSEILVQQDSSPKPKPTILDTRLVKNVNSLKNF